MDEQIKQSGMFGLIALAVTVIAYQIVFNLSGSMMGYVIAVLLGLVVGGITFAGVYFATRG